MRLQHARYDPLGGLGCNPLEPCAFLCNMGFSSSAWAWWGTSQLWQNGRSTDNGENDPGPAQLSLMRPQFYLCGVLWVSHTTWALQGNQPGFPTCTSCSSSSWAGLFVDAVAFWLPWTLGFPDVRWCHCAYGGILGSFLCKKLIQRSLEA